MRLKLKVWRQSGPQLRGRFEKYELDGCDSRMSVLELLDHLNEMLTSQGKAPVAFESDCREGICGACGLTVDGRPHGWRDNLPACHQRVGKRRDGAVITLEPLRSGLYPVVRDLVVDRGVLDEVTLAGGFASVDTGLAPDADTLPVPHDVAEAALDLAACIGCGACVAACPNGSAALYAGARVAHLASLPIPSLERGRRARAVAAAVDQWFGACSGYRECARVCPAGVDLGATALVAKERWGAALHPART
ncbi:succinate dehydrogenase/fumarate reductase iron-sulfur subunit [Schaalia sp. 19OD2882]|uniref:succinate dehydrogenase/fumarate reductase iron-sulfur subunit n=1 Tax=Schaalia sp. 19OD2882 TaxID=2794089 RepID=UPI001C1F0049|nr:succinate dehydrogenase/fumarate reductase iron-sulfur subunit [Schaalia sp. 19OD2882]QWW18796.1 succinate dehydrogenase/fumarate reductase iron-sulfur subunit [Schaalia sp. 19OD2882]